jgi:putative addiction module component (TIGR02574 family)
MTLLQKLKSEAENLSAPERLDLACFLLLSVDKEEDPGAEAAWDAELARRSAEIDSGKLVGKPAGDVFARLHEKYS